MVSCPLSVVRSGEGCSSFPQRLVKPFYAEIDLPKNFPEKRAGDISPRMMRYGPEVSFPVSSPVRSATGS